MSAYAQEGANMTGGGDASKLAPGGTVTGIVKQGEKYFIVLCPPYYLVSLVIMQYKYGITVLLNYGARPTCCNVVNLS
jgi:hypothetical protein